MSVNQIFCSW